MLTGDRHKTVAHELLMALRIGKAEGVHAEVRQRGVAERRGLLRGQEGLGDRMGREEAVQRRRMGRIFPTAADGPQQLAELHGRGDRKAVEAVGDHIGLTAIGQLEFHGKATRVGEIGRIGNVRNAGEIREAHGHRDRRPGEQQRLTEFPRLRGRHEGSLQKNALGMDRALVMLTECAMQGVHQLRWPRCVCLRRLSGGGDARQCQ